jgi:hypothetical protein
MRIVFVSEAPQIPSGLEFVSQRISPGMGDFVGEIAVWRPNPYQPVAD